MDLVNVAPGQCRLQVDSTTQVSLQRYHGAYLPLKISGLWRAKLIPAAGPTLSNAALVAATLYYCYAFDNSGALALEFSTTAHATDVDTGVEIKSGDASRTLVAMVWMGPGSPGTFVNSTTQRFMRNWFNREDAAAENRYTANRTFTSATFVEPNTEIRIELLNWADEQIFGSWQGGAQFTGAGDTAYTALALDSTTVPINAGAAHTATVSQLHVGSGMAVVFAPAEGHHFLTLLAASDGPTACTLFGGALTAKGTSMIRAWAVQA